MNEVSVITAATKQTATDELTIVETIAETVPEGVAENTIIPNIGEETVEIAENFLRWRISNNRLNLLLHFPLM